MISVLHKLFVILLMNWKCLHWNRVFYNIKREEQKKVLNTLQKKEKEKRQQIEIYGLPKTDIWTAQSG